MGAFGSASQIKIAFAVCESVVSSLSCARLCSLSITFTLTLTLALAVSLTLSFSLSFAESVTEPFTLSFSHQLTAHAAPPWPLTKQVAEARPPLKPPVQVQDRISCSPPFASATLAFQITAATAPPQIIVKISVALTASSSRKSTAQV